MYHISRKKGRGKTLNMHLEARKRLPLSSATEIRRERRPSRSILIPFTYGYKKTAPSRYGTELYHAAYALTFFTLRV